MKRKSEGKSIQLSRSDARSELPTLRQEFFSREKILSIQDHLQVHTATGLFLKSIIYGGLDGSTASIIIILSGISSGTAASDILSIALSALIGSAISMGFGDYLSAKAEMHYIDRERKGVFYSIENDFQEQKNEMIQIYSAVDVTSKQPSYDKQDAKRMVDLISTSKQALADILMLNKNKLVSIDPVIPGRCAIATFFSFLIFGLIPIIPYIITVKALHKSDQQWIPMICLGAGELFSLGFAKGALIGLNKIKSGFEILVFGVLAAGIGYGIGFLFQG